MDETDLPLLEFIAESERPGSIRPAERTGWETVIFELDDEPDE